MPKKATKKSPRAAPPSVMVYERLSRLETMMETQVQTTAALSGSMDEIKLSLQKYKGFWGAVTLIGSAIVATFSLFKDSILALFHTRT